MGLVASAQGEGKKFELAQEMIQQGVLADVVDKGQVPNKYKPGTTQHKAYFVWILEELDSEGRNKRAFLSFTVSLTKTKAGKESNLRKLLKEFGVKITVVDGKELFDGESSVSLEKFIGLKRTLVMSSEDGADGEPYIRILATKAPQGAGVDIPADFVRKQDQPAK